MLLAALILLAALQQRNRRLGERCESLQMSSTNQYIHMARTIKTRRNLVEMPAASLDPRELSHQSIAPPHNLSSNQPLAQ